MELLEQSLAAGIVAGGIWAVAHFIKSRKPAFFWKLNPIFRIVLLFVAVFLLFVLLLLNSTTGGRAQTTPQHSATSLQILNSTSGDRTEPSVTEKTYPPLAFGQNAVRKSARQPSSNIYLEGTVRCEPERYVSAKIGEGTADIGSAYTLIDFDNSTMSRCDDKGCDSYDMNFQHAGIYTNIQPKEPRGFLVKMSDDGEYFEMVSLQLYPLLYFGRCRNLFSEI